MPFKPFKLIKKTVRGDNKLGKFLNKILPYPKLREGVGAALSGIKLGSPVPEKKRVDVEAKVNEALATMEKADGNTDVNDLPDLVDQIYDILDDGKENHSRALSPKITKAITKATSALPLIAYIIYAIKTGDFDLSIIWEYLQGVIQ